MTNTERRLRDLHKDGTLNKRLLMRIRMLAGISVILLGIALFDALHDSLSLALCVAFAALGYMLGTTIFSHMSKVVWDEDQEVISTGRIDLFGIAALVLYVAFDIGVRHYLQAELRGISTVTGYVFSVIGGSLLGRAMGTRRAIHRRLNERNSS